MHSVRQNARRAVGRAPRPGSRAYSAQNGLDSDSPQVRPARSIKRHHFTPNHPTGSGPTTPYEKNSIASFVNEKHALDTPQSKLAAIIAQRKAERSAGNQPPTPSVRGRGGKGGSKRRGTGKRMTASKSGGDTTVGNVVTMDVNDPDFLVDEETDRGEYEWFDMPEMPAYTLLGPDTPMLTQTHREPVDWENHRIQKIVPAMQNATGAPLPHVMKWAAGRFGGDYSAHSPLNPNDYGRTPAELGPQRHSHLYLSRRPSMEMIASQCIQLSVEKS